MRTRESFETPKKRADFSQSSFSDATASQEDLSGREIMSNTDGRISSVAFSLSSNRGPDLAAYRSAVVEFLKQKAEDPSFRATVIYNYEGQRYYFERDLRRWDLPDTSHINYIHLDREPSKQIDSPWIRDGALRSANGNIVLPRDAKNFGYEKLATSEGSNLIHSDLTFEGGDIRATRSYVFIGPETVLRNVQLRRGRKGIENMTSMEISDIVNSFQDQLGRKVVALGFNKSPDGQYTSEPKRLYHTDMIITPLDDKNILVAEMKDNKDLDKMASQLANEGFNVSRLPYLEFDRGLRSTGQITYNNVLLESYGTIKKVYLPEYYRGLETETMAPKDLDDDALTSLNSKAREAYENQGYEVTPVRMSLAMADHRGSLNCITFESRQAK